MVNYTFGPQPAVDITTARLVAVGGLSGSLYASEVNAQSETSPLTVTVAGGVAATEIEVSSFGQLPEFTVADHYQVWWRSGDVIVHLLSFDKIVTAVEGSAASSQTAATAASAALASAQALDASRMKLAGGAVAQGAAFWGVWQQGFAPVPPNDGQVHWGLEIVP